MISNDKRCQEASAESYSNRKYKTYFEMKLRRYIIIDIVFGIFTIKEWNAFIRTVNVNNEKNDVGK